MAKVIMKFNGHDIEGDAATLADINKKLAQHARMLEVLRWAVAAYSPGADCPLWVIQARAVIARAQS